MYYDTERFTLYHGDNREVLKQLPDNSIDSVVTDPPYELGFMGKKWDSTGIAYDVELWREVLRVLKPGGHLLAFSGSRTYHRMAVAIEDAGFDIRDQIMWIYGSGFPKSLDISKAIDKNDATEARRQRDLRFIYWMRETGLTANKCDEILKKANVISETSNHSIHYFNEGQPQVATVNIFNMLRPYLPKVPDYIEEMVRQRTIESENFKNREITGVHKQPAAAAVWMNNYGMQNDLNVKERRDIGATAEAKQWQGWGTALKPAHEPIVLARKPVTATVAANVLEWGVGGLNIDGTRVAGDVQSVPMAEWSRSGTTGATDQRNGEMSQPHKEGRWPANVIHDGSDEVVELFPNSKGNGSLGGGEGGIWTTGNKQQVSPGYTDSGSAARFFYCAKASKRDRNEGLDGFEIKQTTGGGGLTEVGGAYGSIKAPAQNHHPTVKPTDLMAYLCRLVTSKDGTVLDPFMGSGSTGKAAMYEGFKFVGIEMTDEYLPIAKARIEFALNEESEKLL